MQPRWLIAEFAERNHDHDYQLELLRSYYERQRQLKVLSDEYLARAQISYANEVRDVAQRNTEHTERQHHANYLDRVAEDLHHATDANLQRCDALTLHTAELVNTWRHQERLAARWVDRATKELDAAQAQLREAQANLGHAKNQLARAQSALAYKRTQYTERRYRDHNGNWHTERIPADTSAEVAAVAQAEHEVSRCNSAVASAQQRVAKGEADLKAANQQLRDTQIAVNDAHAANTEALNAQSYADQACKSASHALNQAQVINQVMQQINVTLGNLADEVDVQGVTLSHMKELNAAVRQLLQHIDHDLAEIIQQTYMLKGVLDEKANLLYAYDSPE